MNDAVSRTSQIRRRDLLGDSDVWSVAARATTSATATTTTTTTKTTTKTVSTHTHTHTHTQSRWIQPFEGYRRSKQERRTNIYIQTNAP